MKLIYADFNATTPCHPEHLDYLIACFSSNQGNPSSIHQAGRRARVLMQDAREYLASCLGAKASQIIFTSGATEANNWVLKHFASLADGKDTILLSEAEHSSIKAPALHLAATTTARFATYQVDKNAIILPSTLLDLVDSYTTLVCLLHVNNETGSINHVFELAQEIKKKNPKTHIHVDGVQALGKLDLTELGQSAIDSYALSGHKIGALQGIGALWQKEPKSLAPFILGGGQEQRRRHGTENLIGIVSFGQACREIEKNLSYQKKLFELREYFLNTTQSLRNFTLNVDPKVCVPGTINFHIKNKELTQILIAFERHNICASAGSACSSGSSIQSPVLSAMGLAQEVAKNSIRLSFGVGSSTEDIEKITAVIKQLD